MSIINLLPTSKYGFKGQKPAQFDLGPGSTLSNTSQLDNNPNFATYQDAYLRGKSPTKMTPPAAQLAKYMNNLPG